MDLSHNILRGMLPEALDSLGSLEMLQMDVSKSDVEDEIRDVHTMFSLVDRLISSLRLNPGCLAMVARLFHHVYLQ